MKYFFTKALMLAAFCTLLLSNTAQAQFYYLTGSPNWNDSIISVHDTISKQAVFNVGITTDSANVEAEGIIAMATEPGTGAIWVVFQPTSSSSNRRLGVLNPLTGQISSRGPQQSNLLIALAFAPNGDLYGLSGYNNNPYFALYSINKTNGAITVVNTFNSFFSNQYGLRVAMTASSNGTFYFAVQDSMYKLRPPYTGSLINIPNTYPSSAFNLAGDLSGMFTHNNLLYIMEKNGNAFALVDTNGTAASLKITRQTGGRVLKDTLGGGSRNIESAAWVLVPCTPYFDFTIGRSAPGFCPGDSVKLNAPVRGASRTFQWTRNGVDISGATDSVYFAKQGGRFNCRVRSGSCTDTASAFVTVTAFTKPNITLSAQGTASLFCANNDSVVIVGQPAGAGGSLAWYRNGVLIPNETGTNLTVRQAGSYNQFKTNQSGCGDSAAVAFVVDTADVVASFTASRTQVDLAAGAGTVNFTSTGSCANSYEYSFGETGSTNATTANASHTYTTVGNWTVTLTVRNTLSNRVDTETVVINVVNNPTAIAPGVVNEVNLYPNPTQGTATLRFVAAENLNASLTVTNMVGQTVFSQTVNAAAGVQTRVELPAVLNSGTYLVRLSRGAETLWTSKLVRN